MKKENDKDEEKKEDKREEKEEMYFIKDDWSRG
jgi:hypothetical protein